MSSVAVDQEPGRADAICASRLIPGLDSKSRLRKPLSSYRVQKRASPGAVASISHAESRRLLSWAPRVAPHPEAANPWTLWTSLGLDWLVILLSWSVASRSEVLVRRLWPMAATALSDGLSVRAHFGFGLLFGVIVTLLAYSEGFYREQVRSSWESSSWILCRASAWGMALVGIAVLLSGWNSPAVADWLIGTGLNIGGFLAWRTARDRLRVRRVRRGGNTRNVLIVGTGRAAREIAAYLESHPELGRSVRGFIGQRKDFGVLGSLEDLAGIARAEFVDELIVAAPDVDLIQRVIHEASRNHLDVRVVPDLFGYQPCNPRIEAWGHLHVLTLHQESWPSLRLTLKRILDLAGSAIGLAVFAPMLGAIALLIKLDSPGPALYAAPRVGRKGRRFRCLKFRTMRVNADTLKDELRSQNQREGPCFKIAADPRITRVGRVLRRYSLDEFPQLWNVLRGEMSLVGPRPHPVDDFARYELGHFRRLDVTPGITGLWQIRARRSPSFQTNMALDLEYIEKWSLRMDLRILWKTVAVVMQGTGA